MFCFVSMTNEDYVVAENVSATFLCPETTPQTALCEEQSCIPCLIPALLSGDTPADVICCDIEDEYTINAENTAILSVASLPLAIADDFIGCEAKNSNSDAVISVTDELRENSCPMFLVEEHIPSNFYVTVCDSDYLPLSAGDLPPSAENGKYCCSVRGFSPCGMELKIRVQSFKL